MEFGDKCKDVVTGFEGIVIGKCSYMTGCDTVLLCPPVDKDGKRQDGEWFDFDRLTVIEAGAIRRADDTTTTARSGLMSRLSVGADIAPPTK